MSQHSMKENFYRKATVKPKTDERSQQRMRKKMITLSVTSFITKAGENEVETFFLGN